MQIRFECHYHNSLKVILFYENSSTGNKVFLLPPEIINVRFFWEETYNQNMNKKLFWMTFWLVFLINFVVQHWLPWIATASYYGMKRFCEDCVFKWEKYFLLVDCSFVLERKKNNKRSKIFFNISPIVMNLILVIRFSVLI